MRIIQNGSDHYSNLQSNNSDTVIEPSVQTVSVARVMLF